MRRLISALLIVFEIILVQLIIKKVPYTEIDWTTYHEQISLFLGGERDYSKIEGATGPIVYPAGYVYVYAALHNVTEGGRDIVKGQYIFGALYVAVLAVVLAIYGKTKKVPLWALSLLVLSRRVHSLFMLRLFNDCFATFFAFFSILSLVNRKLLLTCILFSLAVSVKMNVLLYAPSLLVILLKTKGIKGTIPLLSVCALVQVALGAPFVAANWRAYLRRSFDLGRKFIYHWSVNWKMVSEPVFLSNAFAVGLLAAHLLVLLLFAHFKWCRHDGGLLGLIRWNKKAPHLSVDHVLYVMFTGNFVGVLFSRSLHYQFYLWYFHTLPFLLFATNLPTTIRVMILCAIELSWNIFPSTPWSSSLLLASHLLLLAGLVQSDPPPPLQTQHKADKSA